MGGLRTARALWIGVVFALAAPLGGCPSPRSPQLPDGGDGDGGGGGGGLPSLPQLRATMLVSGVRDVAPSGDFAYAACSHGLAVYRAEDAGYRLVGNLSVPLGPSPRIVLGGQTAYVAAGPVGVAILAVGVAEAPRLASTYRVEGCYCVDVVERNRVLHVADRSTGLRVLDVRDPTAPSVRAIAPASGALSVTASVDGGRSYLGTEDGVIVAFDTASFGAVELGRYEAADDAILALCEADGLLYCLIEDLGLVIVNAAVPARMQEVARLPLDAARAMRVRDGRAYVAVAPSERAAALVVVGVSDPLEPSVLGRYELPGLASIGPARDGAVCVALGSDGVMRLNAGDPEAIGVTTPFADARHVGAVATRRRVGCAGYLGGLVFTDLTDLRYPRETARVEAAGEVVSLDISGDRAAAVDLGASELLVASVPRSDAPRLLARLSMPDARAVALSGQWAFVACGTIGLTMVDLASPDEPRLRSTLSLEGASADALDVSRGYVYVGDTAARRLVTVDATDPESADVIGTLELLGAPRALTTAGEFLLSCCGPEGLVVLGIADPASPRLLGRVELPGPSADVGLSLGAAYTAAEDAGLRLVSLDDPTAPRPYVYLDTAGSARGVALDDGVVLVADWDALLVLEQ